LTAAGRQDPDVVVTVTRSAGLDGAVLVMIDTTFDPAGADHGPGLRVLVNDHPAWAGVAYQPVAEDTDPVDTPTPKLTVALAELTPAANPPAGRPSTRSPGRRAPPPDPARH
jgi:hypothetical protein